MMLGVTDVKFGWGETPIFHLPNIRLLSLYKATHCFWFAPRRGGQYFSLLAQRKVLKRKGTPLFASAQRLLISINQSRCDAPSRRSTPKKCVHAFFPLDEGKRVGRSQMGEQRRLAFSCAASKCYTC